MLNQCMAIVSGNRQIAESVYEMVLQVPEALEEIRPGQFLNLQLEGFFLRRPISICDWDQQRITLIYKVVGKGTEHLSSLPEGSMLDVLLPLGNGYDLAQAGLYEHPLLIGGGAGVPPMYGLAKRLISQGVRPTVLLGFRSAQDVFYREEFEALGVDTHVVTEDGSTGEKGFATDVMRRLSYDSFYACGPEPMLRAVDAAAPAEAAGFMSFEERMGCGFGACMGCSCRTKYGAKRICKDGPVLERSEILW